jgi:DNA polymerase-3 subunit epsilon
VKWWEGPLGAFDLETTGTDTRTDRIMQYCVALGAPGYAPQVMSGYVSPGIPAHPKAIEAHGITDEFAERYGAPPRLAVEICVSELANLVKAKIPITGHNLAYDFALLHWECVRYGLPTLLERTGGLIMPVVDLYVLDKYVEPFRRGKGMRKLGAVVGVYGVRLEGAHDAIADCLAATECVRVIAKRYREIGNMGPMQLHTCQVEWRAEQCAGLQDYFRYRRKDPPPDPKAYVDPCWPICLDLTHPTA